jgi:uncharacterized protein (TIGR00290 family)
VLKNEYAFLFKRITFNAHNALFCAMKHQAALFWSGGKDSAYALHYVLKHYPELEIVLLITTVNAEYKRISMHGVREGLLEMQAKETGIPLYKMMVANSPSNSLYEDELGRTLKDLKQRGISHIVFGDIFLEDLREYRLKFLSKHGLEGVFPLWKNDTSQLIHSFLELGFRTITCCISTAFLDGKFVGKEIDAEFLKTLPGNVDPCGENGEFHTFCFDGPVFKNSISYTAGEKVYKPLTIKTCQDTQETGFWYIDLVPAFSV